MRLRLSALLLSVLALAAPAAATWSIVVVNLRTGEVCVASATCIENFNLRANLGIMASEVGGGAAQALVSSGSTRVLIHDLMVLGVPPEEILDEIESFDSLFQHRQFGFVDLAGRAVSFTGSQAADWAGGVTGRDGDYVYAIQGNILTGQPVVDQCELAFLNTSGDLGQKVMAAMEAARDMGGDGRCSCSSSNPTGCGAPPPNFSKSAHVGFFIIARPGDVSTCSTWSCAGGDLYLEINKASLNASDPDPVTVMRGDFDAWRAALAGRPDAVRSSVISWQDGVEPGSTTPASFLVDLADVDGNALTSGGAQISLVHDPASAGLSTLHQVVDHNDGTYTVEVMPGDAPGLDRLRFVVDDGVRPVTLWPPATLLHEPPEPAPLQQREPVPGLGGFAGVRAAHLTPDGLDAWIVGDRGQGAALWHATRAQTGQPFGAPAAVGVQGLPLDRVTSLWVSDDGLTMIVSARAPQRERILGSTRADLQSDFPAPLLDPDLNAGAGDGGVAVSPDGLQVAFHSRRGGEAALWRARRLSTEARWFPPEPIAELDGPGTETAPLWTRNGTRLWFTHAVPGEVPRLHHADLDQSDAFAPPAAAAGVFGDAAGIVAAAADPGDGALWTLTRDAGGSARLERAPRPGDTLLADRDALSHAAGGVVTFRVDAGPAHAGRSYRMLAGAPLAGGAVAGRAVLPVQPLPSLSMLVLQNANGTHLPGFRGVLDAQGRATAQWRVPAGGRIPASLLDRDYGFACLAADAQGTFVSRRATVRLLP